MQKPIETFDPRRFYMQKPQRLLTPAMRDFKPPRYFIHHLIDKKNKSLIDQLIYIYTNLYILKNAYE